MDDQQEQHSMDTIIKMANLLIFMYAYVCKYYLQHNPLKLHKIATA